MGDIKKESLLRVSVDANIPTISFVYLGLAIGVPLLLFAVISFLLKK